MIGPRSYTFKASNGQATWNGRRSSLTGRTRGLCQINLWYTMHTSHNKTVTIDRTCADDRSSCPTTCLSTQPSVGCSLYSVACRREWPTVESRPSTGSYVRASVHLYFPSVGSRTFLGGKPRLMRESSFRGGLYKGRSYNGGEGGSSASSCPEPLSGEGDPSLFPLPLRPKLSAGETPS